MAAHRRPGDGQRGRLVHLRGPQEGGAAPAGAQPVPGRGRGGDRAAPGRARGGRGRGLLGADRGGGEGVRGAPAGRGAGLRRAAGVRRRAPVGVQGAEVLGTHRRASPDADRARRQAPAAGRAHRQRVRRLRKGPAMTGYATSLGASDEHTITVLGQNLAEDLMGKVSFGELAFWLVAMRRPTPGELRLFEAVLVALADHGLTPTVLAARLTLTGAPESVQGALAAGLLGGGSRFLGVTEDAGRFLSETLAGRPVPESDEEFEALA